MSQVVDKVKEEVEKVVEEAKHLFLFEKNVVQKFLDYLAKRPYAEVFEIIEAIKTGKVVTAPPVPTPVVSQEVKPGMAQAQAAAAEQSLNPNS